MHQLPPIMAIQTSYMLPCPVSVTWHIFPPVFLGYYSVNVSCFAMSQFAHKGPFGQYESFMSNDAWFLLDLNKFLITAWSHHNQSIMSGSGPIVSLRSLLNGLEMKGVYLEIYEDLHCSWVASIMHSLNFNVRNINLWKIRNLTPKKWLFCMIGCSFSVDRSRRRWRLYEVVEQCRSANQFFPIKSRWKYQNGSSWNRSTRRQNDDTFT